MKNKASIWCYISGVIAYGFGIIYCMSLLFIPFGIYMVIFGGRYFKFAALSDSQLAVIKPYLKSSAWFVSILGFPLGLFSIIPYMIAGANNVKVRNVQSEENESVVDNSTKEAEEKPVIIESVEVKEAPISDDEINKKFELLSVEDQEKISKLKNFRDKGFLDAHEYNEAINQILNK